MNNLKSVLKVVSKKETSLQRIFLVHVILIYSLYQNNYVYAAEDIWSKAQSIMADVYSKIVGISTVAAVVTASVALLMMNFSRNGKTVDESRTWLKRIVITWMILNGLGFIMAYITPLFQGGQYTI